jgi:hypothetical protein
MSETIGQNFAQYSRYYYVMLSSFTVNYTIVALQIFLRHRKQNPKSKSAMPHSPDAMAPGKDQNDVV